MFDVPPLFLSSTCYLVKSINYLFKKYNNLIFFSSIEYHFRVARKVSSHHGWSIWNLEFPSMYITVVIEPSKQADAKWFQIWCRNAWNKINITRNRILTDSYVINFKFLQSFNSCCALISPDTCIAHCFLPPSGFSSPVFIQRYHCGCLTSNFQHSW